MLNCQTCGNKKIWNCKLGNVVLGDVVWCPIIRAFVYPQNVSCGCFCDYHTKRYKNEDPSDSD